LKSARHINVPIAVAASAAVAFLLGCGGSPNQGAAQNVSAVSGATGSSGATGVSGATGESGATGFSGAAEAGVPEAPPESMDETAFWQLISETRNAADNDTGRQSQLLEQRLRQLAPEQIAGFEQIRDGFDKQAYTWDLWGAAYVIEDGCSDDCFRDFRAYLISLGRETYEAALSDPDSLAGVVEDAEKGDWENADNVAAEAYEDATDEDVPGGDSDLSGKPSGEEWDDDNQEALVDAYPSLAERFR
jgi:hypothetical protein